MLKTLAALRTIFLIFIIGYTVRAMPFFTSVARTFDEQYARCAQGISLLLRAAWFAIGWIGLETILGWILATRVAKRARAIEAAGGSGGAPPVAPPGHR